MCSRMEDYERWQEEQLRSLGVPTAEAQANTPSSTMSAQDAGKKLARLMEHQLGYSDGRIDSIALRLFIRAYWSQVSHLAHIIHGEK